MSLTSYRAAPPRDKPAQIEPKLKPREIAPARFEGYVATVDRNGKGEICLISSTCHENAGKGAHEGDDRAGGRSFGRQRFWRRPRRRTRHYFRCPPGVGKLRAFRRRGGP